MLQNPRVIAYTVSELLRENQQGGWNYPTPPPPRLGLIKVGRSGTKVGGNNLKIIKKKFADIFHVEIIDDFHSVIIIYYIHSFLTFFTTHHELYQARI